MSVNTHAMAAVVVLLVCALGAATPSASAQCELLEPEIVDVPIFPVDDASAELWLSADSAIVVRTDMTGAGTVNLWMSSTGSGRVSALLVHGTEIGPNLSLSSDERLIWTCAGGPNCNPAPYNGFGLYGFKFTLDGETHYGWLTLYLFNPGWNGNWNLRFIAARYNSCADQPVFAGRRDLGGVASCDSADFDCDDDSGTDRDIEAFFSCLGGNCPASPCDNDADFDNDGAFGTDADIEAFFRVLGGTLCDR